MTNIVIKQCKCKNGTKTTYIQDHHGLGMICHVVPNCKGCNDEIFPNKSDNGKWVFSKGDVLCIFTNLDMKTGGLFLHEERKI